MCDIPLDLQRRLERRWAARFSRPNPPTAPQKHEPERKDPANPRDAATRLDDDEKDVATADTPSDPRETTIGGKTNRVNFFPLK